MLTDEDFNRLLALSMRKDNFLKGKDEALIELIEMCESEEQKELLYMLLSKFTYVNHDVFDDMATEIANYIKTQCAGREEESCVAAMSMDDQPDSGELLLYYLKVPLYKEIANGLHTVNRCGRINREYKEHQRTNFIVVDIFTGSGKTIRNRYNAFKKEYNIIQFCLMTGMKHAIEELQKEGIPVYCVYEIEKGISDHRDYTDEERRKAIEDMLGLESKLAPEVRNRRLEDYSLGYGGAESLIAYERFNTPNNVFPIFWWEKTANNKERTTLLTYV